MTHKEYVDVKLRGFLDEAPECDKKPIHPVVALFGFFLFAAFSGVLATALVLPLFSPAAAIADATQAYWDDLKSDLPEIIPPQRSLILDANGNELAEFFVENRVLTELEEVSPNVIDALLSTEDRHFYTHSGVDHRGIARAFLTNTVQGTGQGASTITQQLVKNTLLLAASNEEERQAAIENSYGRKLEEVKYALALEEKYDKDEILERYLNIALFSNGVYGIGTAADYYFSKTAADLTVPEAALLVGLLKNPSSYDPINNPINSEDRRNLVLKLMLNNKKLTVEEYDEAVATPVGLNINKPDNGCTKSESPYYCQWVVNSIHNDPAYGETETERQNLIYWGGLTIHTHFDPQIQYNLQHTADRALGRDNRAATSIATVVPGTGAVPGFAQNRTWGADGETEDGAKRTQVIYADRTSFQSGSSFKVFTLLAALESGMSPHTKINAPAVYNPPHMNTPPGGITNISRSGTGVMDAYTATARSSNTWYTVVQEKVGVLKVAEMAEALGIKVPRTGGRAVTSKDSSFTLGTISVSPLQMAAAYAAIANGGEYCEPHGVSKIVGPTGELVYESTPENRCRRVFSEETASTATDILRGVVESDDPNRTVNQISMNRPVAGKTGTANKATEVWFVGYTPQYATSVWVGDPRGAQKYPLGSGFRYYDRWLGDGYSMQVYGGAVAAPIWKEATDFLHSGLPVKQFEKPAGFGVSGTVPDVRGLSVDAARTYLENAGWEVTISEKVGTHGAAGPVGRGVVVDQVPAPGGRTITQGEFPIELVLSGG